MVICETATYRDNEEVPIFRANPFIAALSNPKNMAEMLSELTYMPESTNAERNISEASRILSCQQVYHFFQPNRNSLDVYSRLDSVLRWGYVNRNPLNPSTVERMNRLGNETNCFQADLLPPTFGFTMIGVSGVGKTRTIERVLQTYPQVIRHTEYHGLPLCCDQVVWLKCDCAPDGSLRGLFKNFMAALDNAIGTRYAELYDSSKYTMDQLLLAVRKMVMAHNVGILVIDELQHLCNLSGKISKTVLNVFVALVNQIGIPVITCGTNEAMDLFRNDFQQARRGSGKGEVFFERMSNDQEWNRFLGAMWRLQYTRTVVPLTDEMQDAFYSESLGIPYIATHLYDLAQEDAIMSGTESFTPADIHRIATKKMLLTAKIRNDIREGKNVDFTNKLDVSSPNIFPNWEQSVPVEDISSQIPAQRKETNIQQAVIFLAEILKKDKSEVRNYVNAAAAKHETPVEYQILFQEAYALYLEKKSNATSKPAVETPLENASCYEDLINLGMIDAEVGM